MMAGGTVGKSKAWMVSWLAYSAGIMGTLANLLLIAFFALQASQPENETSLGSANDLVGSLATAFMIVRANSRTALARIGLFHPSSWKVTGSGEAAGLSRW
jgi:hypothetical protein